MGQLRGSIDSSLAALRRAAKKTGHSVRNCPEFLHATSALLDLRSVDSLTCFSRTSDDERELERRAQDLRSALRLQQTLEMSYGFQHRHNMADLIVDVKASNRFHEDVVTSMISTKTRGDIARHAKFIKPTKYRVVAASNSDVTPNSHTVLVETGNVTRQALPKALQELNPQEDSCPQCIVALPVVGDDETQRCEVARQFLLNFLSESKLKPRVMRMHAPAFVPWPDSRCIAAASSDALPLGSLEEGLRRHNLLEETLLYDSVNKTCVPANEDSVSDTMNGEECHLPSHCSDGADTPRALSDAPDPCSDAAMYSDIDKMIQLQGALHTIAVKRYVFRKNKATKGKPIPNAAWFMGMRCPECGTVNDDGQIGNWCIECNEVLK